MFPDALVFVCELAEIYESRAIRLAQAFASWLCEIRSPVTRQPMQTIRETRRSTEMRSCSTPAYDVPRGVIDDGKRRRSASSKPRPRPI